MSDLDLDELRATYDHPADRGVIELIDRLEQAEKNADTYQTLYEQRAESLEQAEGLAKKRHEVIQTLGRIIDQQCESAVLGTNSQDVIDTEGDWDGDWDVVWERVAELADKKHEAEAQVARVREVIADHSFVADDIYGDLAASQYYGDRELEAVVVKSIIRALDGDPRG